jgi:hypothetical protein
MPHTPPGRSWSRLVPYPLRAPDRPDTLEEQAGGEDTESAAGHRQSPDVQLQKLLAGRVPGRPTDCISLLAATSSQIIEGKAIVYRVGGTLYLNVPRSGADNLGSDDILVTHPTGSQLCSIDTVRLVDRVSHFQNGFVAFGELVPYRKAKLAS